MKTQISTKGVKTSYRCNQVKRYGEQSSHAIYTLMDYEPNNTEIQLYRNNWPHDHDNHGNRVTRISDEMKKAIYEMMDENHAATPKFILHRCQEKYGEKAPTRKQISNIMQHYKSIKYGTAKITTWLVINPIEGAHLIVECAPAMKYTPNTYKPHRHVYVCLTDCVTSCSGKNEYELLSFSIESHFLTRM